MTRQNAIEQLENLKEYCNDMSKIWESDVIALNVAIETLKNLKTNDRNATNGDMIKAMFPNAKICTNYYTYCVEVKLEYHGQDDTGLLFDKGWWNAPYKRGE